MPTIHYPHQISYSYDEDGNLLPRLALAVSKPQESGKEVDVDAYLDSGAERSLFSGWIGKALGLDILSGSRVGFETTMGTVLTATMHPVRLSHMELGDFEVEVGFRERYQVFYASPERE